MGALLERLGIGIPFSPSRRRVFGVLKNAGIGVAAASVLTACGVESLTDNSEALIGTDGTTQIRNSLKEINALFTQSKFNAPDIQVTSSDSSYVITQLYVDDTSFTRRKVVIEFANNDPTNITAIEISTGSGDHAVKQKPDFVLGIQRQERKRLSLLTNGDNSTGTLITQSSFRVDDHFFQSTEKYATDLVEGETIAFSDDTDFVSSRPNALPIIELSSESTPKTLRLDEHTDFIKTAEAIKEKFLLSQTSSQNRGAGN